MANESKNPVFWSAVSFVAGLVIGVWGHLRSEATTAEGATFSTPMMIIGGLLAAAGLIGFFTVGNRKK